MSAQMSTGSYEGKNHPGYFKRYSSVNRFAAELLGRLRGLGRPAAARQQRLALVARIPLGPNQAVALIEAEGRQLLVATSGDGTPSFYPLHAGNSAVLSTEASAGRASC
jgi:hypothetical protein